MNGRSAVTTGARRPPGNHDSLDDLEKSDRTAIARRSVELGPIFTGTSYGELTTCIVGLQLGRRFLQEHRDALDPITLDLTTLIPKGFLRRMQGTDHRDYRRSIVRAARALDNQMDASMAESVYRQQLDRLQLGAGDDSPRRSPLLDVASDAATAILVLLFFGAAPGSALFDELTAEYGRLGPYGLVWNLGPAQHTAYAALRDRLRIELDRRHDETASMATMATMADGCILAQVAADGDVDDTMLGNLIYMVEMGRQDLQVFFRWLLSHAVDNRAAMERIAEESSRPTVPGRTTAESFVLETLRSDQSERLGRRVTQDIVFDGYLIPENSLVRICMWEAHHQPDVFADPHKFKPERFLESSPSNDEFSPFGIDHHQCPFALLTIELGTALLRTVAQSYSVAAVDNGPTIRGPYHWEPSRRLRLHLGPR